MNPHLSAVRWAATLCLMLVLALAGPATAKKKEPIGRFSGTVLNQQEEPLAGTTVTVTALAAGGFSGEVITDKKGEFSLSVPNATGEYQLRLVKEGYAPFEQSFLLEAGDEQNIVFRLLDAAAGRREEAKAAYNQGVGAFNAGDLAAAKERFEAAIVADPELPEPHRGLAEILLREGAAAQALVHADKFLAAHPDDQATLEIAWRAATQAGDQARVAELRPRLQGAGGALARTAAVDVYNEGARAVQRQELEAALAKFKAAVEIDPELVPAWSALASIHYSREEYEPALAAVGELLRLEPGNVEGLRYRYLVHDARGEPAAAEAFEAYVAVDPKGAAATLYRRADLDYSAGDVAAARTALERVIAIDPGLARAYYTLGLSYAASDVAKAKENLRKFLELAPEDPEADTAREMLQQL